MVEHNSQENEEDLENIREVVEMFKGKMNAEVRRQEKLDMVEKKRFQEGGVTREVYSKDVIWVE